MTSKYYDGRVHIKSSSSCKFNKVTDKTLSHKK